MVLHYVCQWLQQQQQQQQQILAKEQHTLLRCKLRLTYGFWWSHYCASIFWPKTQRNICYWRLTLYWVNLKWLNWLNWRKSNSVKVKSISQFLTLGALVNVKLKVYTLRDFHTAHSQHGDPSRWIMELSTYRIITLYAAFRMPVAHFCKLCWLCITQL